jgi:hypothetical protein
MAEKRNFVVLGVAPGQFLVRADGPEDEVRAGLTKLLPGVTFELKPVTGKAADTLRGRLSDAQLQAFDKLPTKVGVSMPKSATSFQLTVTSDVKMAAAATKDGILKFNPSIEKVRKPLGGIGPVGVTVGVGIAGKF